MGILKTPFGPLKLEEFGSGLEKHVFQRPNIAQPPLILVFKVQTASHTAPEACPCQGFGPSFDACQDCGEVLAGWWKRDMM